MTISQILMERKTWPRGMENGPQQKFLVHMSICFIDNLNLLTSFFTVKNRKLAHLSIPSNSSGIPISPTVNFKQETGDQIVQLLLVYFDVIWSKKSLTELLHI